LVQLRIAPKTPKPHTLIFEFYDFIIILDLYLTLLLKETDHFPTS